MADGRFPIRLLALDIDGTLVGDDLVVRERTHAAIRAAVQQGVAVSLITGRMATSAMQFAAALELTGPVLAYHGGLIRAMPEPGSRRLGRLLYHRTLSADVARDVVAWTTERGLNPHLSYLERFIVRRDDPEAESYFMFLGSRARLVPDLVAAVTHRVSKVLASGDEPGPIEALEQARDDFAGRADVLISHPRYLEFIPPGVSKGRGVRWLARRLGIPLEQSMAIGDQYNDIEMLAEVGHGVAMPTAPAAVQAVARYIAPSLEEEGAAQMIEELVLRAHRPKLRFLRKAPTQASA